MKAHEKAFIDTIAPIIVKKCKEHGWGVPSAIIAQACVESVKASSLSDLAAACNNFYGMKWVQGCGTDYKCYTATEQRKDGTYYMVTGTKWRKYNSVEEGIEGYFRFIESYKRYKPVIAAKNCTEYARQLKECGWATSISYTNSILNRIKADCLSIYDSLYGLPYATTTNTVQNTYVVGKTYTLDSDLYVRAAANGAKVEFDDLTDNAKENAVEDASGYAILKKGTKVTCKSIKTLTTSTWIQIPSGWICAKNPTKKYVI